MKAQSIRCNEETVQDMKIEIESLKKTQTKVKLKMNNLGSQIKISEISLINILQNLREKISDTEESRRNAYLIQRKC